MEDAESYYKPASVDVVENVFVSRSLLIRYTGEEASLRDSCCWRIEVPYDDVKDSPLSFQIDLYSQSPIKRDNRVIAYSEKPTVGVCSNCSTCNSNSTCSNSNCMLVVS